MGATGQNLQAGTAVITGAASAAGSSIALAFADHGGEQIFLGDNSLEGLEACRDAVNKEYPSAKVYIQAFDRSSEESVDEFFLQIMEKVSRIDFVVNLVSQSQDPTIPVGLSIEEFDRSFKVHQRGAFLLQRAALRQMMKQEVLPETGCRGSIVNVVDHGPTPSLANLPVAAVVAFAIIGFSKTDAVDYATDKIRVNCVAAGEVLIQKTKPELPGGVPLPRKGSPRDIANAAVWLSTPSSSWLTGLVVPVDGGRSLHHLW